MGLSGIHFRTPEDLRVAYENGLPGSHDDPRGRDSLFADHPELSFAARPDCVALRGSGAGKRALLWRYRDEVDPGALGMERQTTGDCVSHGSRNARDITRCVEIYRNGEAESYFARGATEPTYGARGHGGQGMSPALAARFEVEVGFLVRQEYPGVVDLSTYDSRIGTSWGRSGVPEPVKALCREHNVGNWVSPGSIEDARDLIANGFAGHGGQNVGFSTQPDKHGCSVPQGRWLHDMCTAGMDDTKEVYPELVFFVPNSWGEWNERPKNWPEDLYGPWVPGIIVCRASDYGPFVRDAYYYSDIDGYPPRTLPDLGSPREVLG